MERREPLRRKTPLKATANTLRRTPLKTSARKRRPKVSDEHRLTAFKRSRGKCIVCSARVKLQAHHVLPVRDWPMLANMAENMVGVCPGCHDNHERAHRRIRWDELPQCAITLAYSTSGAAAVYVERTYPRSDLFPKSNPCPPFDADTTER